MSAQRAQSPDDSPSDAGASGVRSAPLRARSGFGALLRGRSRFTAPSRARSAVGPMDPLLFGVTVALVMFGVVMVYSASSVREVRALRFGGSGHAFLIKQTIYAVLGLGITWLLSRVDYRRLRGVAKLGLLGSFALLLLVVVGLGHTAGGAARWIRLGFFNIQPAEVAKVGLILWLADSLSKKGERVREFAVGFVPHALVAALLVALCMLQPDFGSSVVLMLLTFVLMFTAGVRSLYMFGASGLALGFAYVALSFTDYRVARMKAFLDPLAHRQTGGYQIVESWVSFSEGGLWGVGLGDSRQKMLFLPEAHTDFIAAIVAEELGFIGFTVLVCAFALLVVRGLYAAFRAPDRFGTYLGVGYTMFIGIQAATNLAVVLGLLPTKGLTLPFLSFGGSSLLVNCAALGILLSVSRPGREPERLRETEAAAPPPRRVTTRVRRAPARIELRTVGSVKGTVKKGVSP
jgi:cell division protein FtsW